MSESGPSPADLIIADATDIYEEEEGELSEALFSAEFYQSLQMLLTERGLLVTQADNPAIASPNGLLFEPGGALLVVDFSTGELLRLDVKTRRSEKIAEGFGGGDGLARDADGILYVSDWKGGRTWKLDPRRPDAKPQPYAVTYRAAADLALSADGRYLWVPDMKAGTLHRMAK